MRARRWGWVAALLAAALLLTGCGAGTPAPIGATDAVGAAVPVQWFTARSDAHRQGVENLVPFYDPDVVLDYQALGPHPVRGRAEALEFLNGSWQPVFAARAWAGPVYLSRDAAVTQEVLDIDPAAFVTTMGPEGATSEVLAPALLVWRARAYTDRRPGAVHALATAYVNAWATGSADAVAALYTEDAQLRDSLLAVTAHGARTIADVASQPPASGGLRSATLAQLPDFGGPAVFVAGSRSSRAPLDAIVLLLQFPDAAGCPGDLAVLLTLDPDRRVIGEERYRSLDDLTRCSPDGTLPSGWWDSLQVPDPVRVVRTGTLQAQGSEVEVFNGTPGLEGMIAWGFDQFWSSGFGTPKVTRVVFYDKQVDRCEGIIGMILADVVTLCFDAYEACRDQPCSTWQPIAKRTVLHELAHAWMAEHVDQTTIKEFLQTTGLPTWASTKHPWAERGAELGADTIAWALMDEPTNIYRQSRALACPRLAAYFEELTGRRPPAPTLTCPS